MEPSRVYNAAYGTAARRRESATPRTLGDIWNGIGRFCTPHYYGERVKQACDSDTTGEPSERTALSTGAAPLQYLSVADKFFTGNTVARLQTPLYILGTEHDEENRLTIQAAY